MNGGLVIPDLFVQRKTLAHHEPGDELVTFVSTELESRAEGQQGINKNHDCDDRCKSPKISQTAHIAMILEASGGVKRDAGLETPRSLV